MSDAVINGGGGRTTTVATISLRAWMVEQRLTSRELAEMMGVSESAVSRWIAGQRIPNLVTLLEIERLTERRVPVVAWITLKRRSRTALT